MKTRTWMLALSLVAASVVHAQQPPQGPQGTPPPGPQDPFGRYLFPPELVMQHQQEIGLQDQQRQTIQKEMLKAQTTFLDVQWRMTSEMQKLGHLMQGATIDEAQALDQIDRVLNVEREVKKAQITLLVRIKNALTPAQQAKLAELRDRRTD